MYLCHWQGYPDSEDTWEPEENLFGTHEDCDPAHNTHLLTKHYTQATHDHLHKIHHKHYLQPQTRDARYVEKPLHLPNIHLNTTECNPDTDIHNTSPTLHISSPMARLHTPTGSTLHEYSVTRIQWLWNQYHQHHNSSLIPTLDPPCQDFTTELTWLTQRYIPDLPPRPPNNPTNLKQALTHNTLPPSILAFLIDSFSLTHSYYSSPLTCPLELHNYHSPHPRDAIFGAHGTAYSTQWAGRGLAHPPNSQTAVEALHWARMAAHTDPEALTILILPHEDWYNKRHPLTGPHPDTQVLAHLDPHILKYSPQMGFPTYLARTEPKIVTILCIHQLRTPSIIPIFAERFQHCLEAALHLTELPLTLNPNPLDTPTKVNLSNKWKLTPPPPTILTTPPALTVPNPILYTTTTKIPHQGPTMIRCTKIMSRVTLFSQSLTLLFYFFFHSP